MNTRSFGEGAPVEPSTATDPRAANDELDAVRVRRAELRESLGFVERCLAAPASGRAVVWGETVHDALGTLARDFEAHIEVTEGPAGLHQSILARDLRLTNAVTRLTNEHATMAREIATLLADSEPPVSEPDVDDLRERATTLLGHVVRHRQTGADLVYEAFHTDVGGVD